MERAKAEVESARTSDQGRLQEVLSEKTGKPKSIITRLCNVALTEFSTRRLGEIA